MRPPCAGLWLPWWRPVSCREEPTNGWHRAAVIRLEQDIFTALAGRGKLYVYKTLVFWSQIKSAGWVHMPRIQCTLYPKGGRRRGIAHAYWLEKYLKRNWCVQIEHSLTLFGILFKTFNIENIMLEPTPYNTTIKTIQYCHNTKETAI